MGLLIDTCRKLSYKEAMKIYVYRYKIKHIDRYVKSLLFFLFIWLEKKCEQHVVYLLSNKSLDLTLSQDAPISDLEVSRKDVFKI